MHLIKSSTAEAEEREINGTGFIPVFLIRPPLNNYRGSEKAPKRKKRMLNARKDASSFEWGHGGYYTTKCHNSRWKRSRQAESFFDSRVSCDLVIPLESNGFFCFCTVTTLLTPKTLYFYRHQGWQSSGITLMFSWSESRGFDLTKYVAFHQLPGLESSNTVVSTPKNHQSYYH